MSGGDINVTSKVLPPQKERQTKLILRIEAGQEEFFAESLDFTLVSQVLDHTELSSAEEMLSILSMGAYILQERITAAYQEMGEQPPADQSGLTMIETIIEDEEEQK